MIRNLILIKMQLDTTTQAVGCTDERAINFHSEAFQHGPSLCEYHESAEVQETTCHASPLPAALLSSILAAFPRLAFLV